MQEKVIKPSARMVRKQVFITAEQNRRLKIAAAQSGRAEADLVREGLDLALGDAATTDDNWRERMKQVLGNVDFDDEFAARMKQNKQEQADLWSKRLVRTRKALRGV